MERALICIRPQKIPIPRKPQKCWSTHVLHDTAQGPWNRFTSTLMESHSQSWLSHHWRTSDVLWWESHCLPSLLSPLGSPMPLSHIELQSSPFISRPHAQVESSPGDTVMRLQWVSPSVKNFRVQGWKRLDWWERWLLAMGIKMDGGVRIVWEGNRREMGFFFFFFLVEPL